MEQNNTKLLLDLGEITQNMFLLPNLLAPPSPNTPPTQASVSLDLMFSTQTLLTEYIFLKFLYDAESSLINKEI